MNKSNKQQLTTAIDYLQASFNGIGVLHNPEDNDDVINKTSYIIIEHLWNLILEHKKEREIINKIEQVLDVEWNANEPVHKYLETLQDARHQLNTLKADPVTPKMIRKLICTM